MSNKGELMPLEKQGLHKSNHIPSSCRYITSWKRKPEPARERCGSTQSFLKFCVISGSWEFADLFPPLGLSVGGRCPVRHSEAEWKASSSSMAQSSLNNFPPSRCSALFFPSLPWFVPPCSNAIYLTEPWMQPASCCRCRYIIRMSFRSSCFKFHNHWHQHFISDQMSKLFQ